MEVTRQSAKRITEDVLAEVAKVLERHGLKLDDTGQRTTYGPTTWALKIQAHTSDGVDPLARDFLASADVLGLKPEALGVKVSIPGKGVRTFVGIAASRRKYPVALRDAHGKVMLFTESVIRHFPADVKA